MTKGKQMFSLATFCDTYETDRSDVVICDRRFSFLTPRHLEPFLDPEDLLHDFPLWAKIWEASSVLAAHLTRLPVDPEKRMLEIGCGIGVVGIVAAAFGHRVTMAEYNPHALAFARANAQLNRCPLIDIRHLDWNQPTLSTRFDYIVGSEVIYRKNDIPSLLTLFKALLQPGGSIFLAEGVRQTGVDFWGQMIPFYSIKAKRFTLRSDNHSETIVLFHLASQTP
jgi:2-polyprenyl-3-methyl-5-hydroxy-6-metoxy-1,4-benzoquinol methylase